MAAPAASSSSAPAPAPGPAANLTPLCVLPTWRVASVRCSKGHYLIGLYVLFRSKAQDPKAPPAEFQLGMTGPGGWLGPVGFDFTQLKAMLKTVPAAENSESCRAWSGDYVPQSYRFIPGHEYEFYFIHHPSLDEAKRIQGLVNAPPAEDGSAPKEDFGAPIPLKPDAFGVVEVKEDSANFLPRGDPFYGGWCLFRGMPGRYCAESQVDRLHAHLGALRFPIGDGAEPYLPTDGNGPGDFNKQGGGNLGIIDVRVWGAILAFQKHAIPPPPNEDGKPAIKLEDRKPFKLKDPNVQRALVTADTFDPVISQSDRSKQGPFESMANRWAFLDGEPTDWPAARPAKADGVVDATTAQAIKAWLANGLRKPDPILVQGKTGQTPPIIMRRELAETVWAWDQVVKALGFPEGIRAGSSFRNPLAEVGTTKIGVASNSPHKTGLAVDTGAHGTYVVAMEGWPVVFARIPETEGQEAARWYVFGPSTTEIPTQADPALRDQAAEALSEKLLRAIDAYKVQDPGIPQLAAAARAALAEVKKRIQDDPLKFFTDFYAEKVLPWSWSGWNVKGGGRADEIEAAGYKERHQGRYDLPRLRAARDKAKKDLEALDARAATTKGLTKREQGRQTQLQKDLPELERRVQEAEAMSGTAPPAPLPTGPAKPASADKRYSFLNLTRIGELSLSKGGRSPLRISGIHSTKGMSLRLEGTQCWELSKIAAAVRKALSLQGLEDRFLFVSRSVGNVKSPFTYPLENIDVDFLDKWFASLKKLSKLAGPAPKAKAAPRPLLESIPPRIVVAISANPKDATRYDPIANELSAYSTQRFYSPLPTDAPLVRTGAEWATHLKQLHEKAIANRAELEKKLAEAAAAPPAPVVEPTKPADKTGKKAGGKQPAQKPPPKPKPPPFEQTLLVLQPVFLKADATTVGVDEGAFPIFPRDAVSIPFASGQPRGLEWWHFQRSDLLAGGWYSMMEAIGYSKDGLKRGPFPELYGYEGMGHAP